MFGVYARASWALRFHYTVIIQIFMKDEFCLNREVDPNADLCALKLSREA